MANFENMPTTNNSKSNSHEGPQSNNNEDVLDKENSDKSQEEGVEQKESKEEEKSPDNSSDKDQEKVSEKEKITNVINQINDINEKIFKAKMMAGQDEANIKAIRESMGISSDLEKTPAASFSDSRISKLEEEKEGLAEQKKDWVEKFGKDNLPAGLVMESDEEDRREVNSEKFSPNEKPELTDKEKKEQVETRKAWVEEIKKEAVENFESGLKKDWQLWNAVNLDLTIEIMKQRVPNIIEERMKNYVNGKDNDPDFSMSMSWSSTNFVDLFLGKPNMVEDLDIKLGDKVIRIAEKNDLQKKDDNLEKSNVENKGKVKEVEEIPQNNFSSNKSGIGSPETKSTR